jgi:lysozyme family protein
MNNFDRALEIVLRHEGGYVNDKNDPGGETNKGITIATARANEYYGPMREIPDGVVYRIYRNGYWMRSWDDLPFPIAFNLFDGAVNSGLSRSVRWMQEAIGGLVIDGQWGPKSQAAALDCNRFVAALQYNSIRLDFLTRLKTWPHFGAGWGRRIASNLQVA